MKSLSKRLSASGRAGPFLPSYFKLRKPGIKLIAPLQELSGGSW